MRYGEAYIRWESNVLPASMQIGAHITMQVEENLTANIWSYFGFYAENLMKNKETTILLRSLAAVSIYRITLLCYTGVKFVYGAVERSG